MEPSSASQYSAIWKDQAATSIAEFPLDPVFTRYRCNVLEFSDGNVYPARAVNHDRTTFLRSFDDHALPITYTELCNNDYLCQLMLEERVQRALGRQRVEPHVIVEYCSGCDSKVVKDGCKELLYLRHHKQDTEIHVTQVSGADWSTSQYDMRLACSCLAESGR